MTLKIIIATYLIVLSVTAIFPSSYYFRQTVKAPFLTPYLFLKITLSLISFGRFKMPRLKRVASERFQNIQNKSIQRRGEGDVSEAHGWTSADKEK